MCLSLQMLGDRMLPKGKSELLTDHAFLAARAWGHNFGEAAVRFCFQRIEIRFHTDAQSKCVKLSRYSHPSESNLVGPS
jgi:hypothetical protein